MEKKNIFTAFVFLLFTINILAQNRVYFDKDFNVTTKDKMVYYRETSKEGNLTRIKDFYKNGALQFEGLAKRATPNKEIFEGEVKWYYPNGKIESIKNIAKGKLVGVQQDFDENGRIVNDLIYQSENDNAYSGKIYYYKNEENTFNVIREIEYFQIVKITYFENDINLIRKEVYPKSGSEEETKFYDDKGKYLGSMFGSESGMHKGVEVEYFSNPMSVKSIKEFSARNDLENEKGFFRNGSLKYEYTKKPDKKVFFDKSGKIIAEYINTEGNISEYVYFDNGGTGTYLFYFKDDKNSEIVSAKRITDKGKLISEERFYENGITERKIVYGDKDSEYHTIFYNKDGSKRFEIDYKYDKPYNGTEDNDKGYIVTYKDGEMTEVKFYNYDEVFQFGKKFNPETKIYDGIVNDDDGKLKYTFTTPDYFGQQFGFNGEVVSYFKGKLIGKSSFTDGIITKGIAVMDNEGQRVDFERKGDLLNLKYYDKKNISVISQKNIKISEIGNCKRIKESDLFSTYGNWKAKREKDGTEGYTEDCREYTMSTGDEKNNKNTIFPKVATPDTPKK